MLSETHSPGGGRRLVALDALDGADIPRALRAAQGGLLGPTLEMLEDWLGALASVAIRSERDEASNRVMVATMAEHLANKPLDAVREALSPTRWKFWPSLREVLDVVDALAAKRRAALRAVEDLARQTQAERGERWRQEAMEAERASAVSAAYGREASAEAAMVRAKACAARAAEFGVAVEIGARARIAARLQAMAPTPEPRSAPESGAQEAAPLRLPRPSPELAALVRRQAEARGGW